MSFEFMEMSYIRDIPDYFLERYREEFAAWAAQIPYGGFKPTRLFVFKEGDVAESSPDPEQGKQLLGAWLLAKVSRKGIEIEPLSERDKEAIIKHCARMQAAGIPASARLREPERPGIPVIPFGTGKGNGHAANG
jgi:hypothetical protein